MKEKRTNEEMNTFFMRDMKHYQVRDEKALKGKMIIWMIVTCILAAFAYVSESDYQECMKDKQSIVLCGGGNAK